MATPTTRLKLKKQALSENLNTWGLSNGINGVIDQVDVLAGYLEVDLGTSTSYTFGTTNYSVAGNEHAYRAVKFTGTPASGVTVNIPAVDDFKFIENATGQTITFSNGSTTATLANTFTGYLRTNGSSSITVLVLPDGVNVQTVAANIASVNTVAGISSDVTTVAGISSAVTGVNGIASDVSGVNAIASNVTTVAGISSAVSGVNAIASDVTAVNTDPLKTSIGNVSGNATNINSVASNATNINTVAGINANVTTVAGIASDVTGVNAIASDVTGVNAVSSNVTTVAGISANVTTVAGIASDVTSVNAIASDVSGVNAIASDVTGVNSISSAVTAVDSNSSNVNTVSTNISNVNNVGGSITSVNTVANNLTDVNAFGNTYQISTNNPTTDGGGNPLSSGDLAYVTSAQKLRAYNGTLGAWEDAGSAVSGLRQIYQYVATAGQTLFPATGSISYDQTAGGAAISVYLNGVLLKTTDYTATNGTSVTLASGAGLNDEVTIHTFGTFNAANTYSQSETNTLLAAKADLASPNFSGTPQISGANIITEVSQDTSPALGGDLQMGSFAISDGVLPVKNNGTPSELRLYCEAGSHFVSLKSPAHSAYSGNHSITMPPNTGNSGEFLKTDGNGVTSWAAAGGGSWDLLATTTVSATQNLDFRGSSIFDNSTYGMYCAVFANCNVNFSGNTGSLRTTWLRNGTQAVTQDIIYSQVAWYSSLETSNSGGSNTGYAQLIANDGPGAIMGQVWFTLEAGAAAGSNTGGPAMTWQITENTGFLGNGRAKTAIGHAFINQAYWNTVGTGIDGIRFYTEYSTWHSGKIYMYGLKK